MNLLVARTMSDGKEYEGQARKQFIYKTQTSVTTVIGQASPDADQPTVGGDIALLHCRHPTTFVWTMRIISLSPNVMFGTEEIIIHP